MVETAQYGTQQKHGLFHRHSSNDLYSATWKNPNYTNLQAQPVQPVVLQPSALGQQQSWQQAPLQAPMQAPLQTPYMAPTTGFQQTSMLPGQGLTSTAPLSQVEHVYEKNVINQPVVHQVVHHPINEIHQQHIRKDVYTQPVTQIVPEQRLMPTTGVTSGIYQSGTGFVPNAGVQQQGFGGAGYQQGYGQQGFNQGIQQPAHQKQGFMAKFKAKRAQRKAMKHQNLYGGNQQFGGYGTQMSTGTGFPQQQQWGGVQQVPMQSGLASQPMLGSTGTTGSWVSGQPRY